MTKVQVTFKLSRQLDEKDWVSISRMHAVYGFLAVRLKPSNDELFVEYDASRLSRKEVIGSLEKHGLPLDLPVRPMPPAPEEPPQAPDPSYAT
jgi:hypothetical protein